MGLITRQLSGGYRVVAAEGAEDHRIALCHTEGRRKGDATSSVTYDADSKRESDEFIYRFLKHLLTTTN